MNVFFFSTSRSATVRKRCYGVCHSYRRSRRPPSPSPTPSPPASLAVPVCLPSLSTRNQTAGTIRFDNRKVVLAGESGKRETLFDFELVSRTFALRFPASARQRRRAATFHRSSRFLLFLSISLSLSFFPSPSCDPIGKKNGRVYRWRSTPVRACDRSCGKGTRPELPKRSFSDSSRRYVRRFCAGFLRKRHVWCRAERERNSICESNRGNAAHPQRWESGPLRNCSDRIHVLRATTSVKIGETCLVSLRPDDEREERLLQNVSTHSAIRRVRLWSVAVARSSIW